MSDEIFFNGVRFISAQEAGEISNFTRDYVARLCRDGRVRGRRVGKNWYVDESALKEFLVQQEYVKARRREELASERVQEYHVAFPLQVSTSTSVKNRVGVEITKSKVSVSARKVISPHTHAVQEKLAYATFVTNTKLARVSKNITRIPGALDSALHQHAAYAVSPVVEFAHKFTALTMALMITFGTYAFVDPQSASFARDSILDTGEAIAERYTEFTRGGTSAVLTRANAQLAAVARDPGGMFETTTRALALGISNFARSLARDVNARMDTFVFQAAFPFELLQSRERAAVVVEVAPRKQTTTATTPDSTGAKFATTQTVVNQPVIERIIETERIVSMGGISEEILNAKIQQLDKKLSAEMYSLTSANTTIINNTYETLGAVARGDNFHDIKVTGSDSKWTGGTISGASIAATTLTASGNTTLSGSLNVTGSTQLASLTASGTATFGTVVLTTASSTNATFTNATTTNATSTNMFSSSLVATNATTTNLAITTLTNALLSTNADGSVVATSTLASSFLSLTEGYTLRGSSGGTAEATSTIFLSTASNVGLGTTTPNYALTVSDTGAPQLSLGDSTNLAWTFRNSGGTFYIATSTYSATSSSAAFSIDTNGITSAGAIIPKGTITNNLGSFDLGSSAARWNALWAGTVNIGTSTWSISNGTDGRFSIFDAASGGGNEHLSILTSGNVGIGTTSPLAQLTVATPAGATGGTTNLFLIASSTATATSTLFSVNNTGSTTLFQIPSSLLKTNLSGTIVAAVAGTDYVAGSSFFAFPFTANTYAGQTVNATSTGLWLSGSPLSLIASSTFATFATTTNATTTNLAISGITSAIPLAAAD
ncbi:hypothetical protein A2673_02460, partial [Candidatus Kaiserbacteria bacterium RIFCSPHIGHO2_01_FULL_50_13]